MKKFFHVLEELWVAVAFAEEGAYEVLQNQKVQPRNHQVVRAHAI